MVDDQDLAGLDPYDLMAAEAERLDAYFASASAADWEKPTRCEGWNGRALLAHLASTEDYNQACLDGTVQQFLADLGAKGAVDLASANEIGIHEFDGQTPEQISRDVAHAQRAEPRGVPRATAATSTAPSVRIPVGGRHSTSRSNWQRMPTTSGFRSNPRTCRGASIGRPASVGSR